MERKSDRPSLQTLARHTRGIVVAILVSILAVPAIAQIPPLRRPPRPRDTAATAVKRPQPPPTHVEGWQDQRMPDLRGLPEDSARWVLRRITRDIDATYRQTTSQSADNRVAAHDPQAGARLRPNAHVVLLIERYVRGTSDGPVVIDPQRTDGRYTQAPIDVPLVIGSQRAEGERTVASAGLRVRTTTMHTDAYAAGVIADQEPRPPAQRRRGSYVQLTISLGPDPERFTTRVPDVRRLQTRDAFDSLRSARLTPAPPVEREDALLVGRVIAQQPRPRSVVPIGDTVRLWVGVAPRPPMVPVPDVVGEERAIAEGRVHDQGLRTRTIPSRGDSDTVVRVVRQRPSGGSTAEHGTEVTLVVSRLFVPQRLVMPNVVGMLDAEARQALASIPMPIIADRAPTTVATADGRVISQGPQAGTVITANARPIHLILGRYTPRPPPLVDVPFVVGSSQAVGTTTIESHRLRVRTLSAHSDDYAAGVIADQVPRPPARLSAGEYVQLTVSMGPDSQRVRARVPDVRRLPIGEALESLRRARLTPAPPIQREDSLLAGRVITQRPGPDAEVEVGTRVQLWVGIALQPPTPERPPLRRRTTVPDVVRLPYGEAKVALQRARLLVGALRGGDTSAASIVRAQQPRAGESVAVSTRVGLQLSDSLLVRVPPLIGRPLREAVILAEGATLRLSLGTAVGEDSARTIAQQSPAAGVMVAANSTLLVVLVPPAEASRWLIPLALATLAGVGALVRVKRPPRPSPTPHVALVRPDSPSPPEIGSLHDPLIGYQVTLIAQSAEYEVDGDQELVLKEQDASND